jgi:hypothetical protein
MFPKPNSLQTIKALLEDGHADPTIDLKYPLSTPVHRFYGPVNTFNYMIKSIKNNYYKCQTSPTRGNLDLLFSR